MPDRVLRASMLESDRWLSLAHPVERLAYCVVLLKVDDLGTCDASDGQLVRMWRDACNVKGRDDALRILQALSDADLVRVYESDGKRYIFVPRFRQRFRAKTFRRPPPPENLLHDEPDILQNIRQIKGKSSGMSDTRQSAVGQVTGGCLASAPEGVVVGVGEDGIKPLAAGKPSAPISSPDQIPNCPHGDIVALYAQKLPTLPQPRVWEGKRAENLRARWRWVLTSKKPSGERYATDTESALDFFNRFFGYVAQSDFLTGKTDKWHGCDLAWLVKAENFAKVIEGKYENRTTEAAA